MRFLINGLIDVKKCLIVVVGDSMWQNEKWKRGRVAEGARLEIVWAAMSRRFESSRFRQEVKKTRKGYFLFLRRRKEDSSPRFAWSDSDIPLSSRFRHKINDDPLWVIFYENLRGIYEVLFQRRSNTIRYPCQ